MKSVIVYTKRFELNFDQQNICTHDISELLEELSKEYVLLDANPTITVDGNYQYVSLKLAKIEGRRKIGF